MGIWDLQGRGIYILLSSVIGGKSQECQPDGEICGVSGRINVDLNS